VLGTAMENNGLRAARDFTPHMTLFYGPTPIPLLDIEPIRFAVREVVLIHSERGLSRYNVIDRWPLRP
jgi:2'-5' RNA ligase